MGWMWPTEPHHPDLGAAPESDRTHMGNGMHLWHGAMDPLPLISPLPQHTGSSSCSSHFGTHAAGDTDPRVAGMDTVKYDPARKAAAPHAVAPPVRLYLTWHLPWDMCYTLCPSS